MEKLNWYCVECKSLGIDCEGGTNPIYSDCIYRKYWLNKGDKIKVIATGRIGVIEYWDYVINIYWVKFNDGSSWAYRREYLQAIIEE
ncbi:MAG: hypothetical protein RR313_10970 [Anaerovoracaceae bacterium]